MTDNEILQIFRDNSALLEGHFILSSGLHSDRYVQCAQVLQHPKIAEQLCSELAAKLRHLGATLVAAPALGGILVAHEVGRALGIRALFTERQDGLMTLRRGFTIASGEPVLVVEDVLTTGLSTRETMKMRRRSGREGSGCGFPDRPQRRHDRSWRPPVGIADSNHSELQPSRLPSLPVGHSRRQAR